MQTFVTQEADVSTGATPVAATAQTPPHRGKRPGASRFGQFWGTDPLLEQISNEIDAFQLELDGLRRRTAPHLDGPSSRGVDERISAWWRKPADDLVELARCQAGNACIAAARDALHHAKRLSLYQLDDQELEATARTLRAEIKSKLFGWRRKAALRALDTAYPAQSSADHSTPPTARVPPWPPRALTHAQELLDEYTRNVDVKLRVAGQRLRAAAILLALTILGLYIAVVNRVFGKSAPDSGSFVLNDPELFLGVLLLGVFGAMLSLALGLSQAKPTESRIYELTSARIAVPVARLSIGGGSAVLVVAATQAAFPGNNSPLLYLTAVPAAFSERLVRRSVEALESSTTKA